MKKSQVTNSTTVMKLNPSVMTAAWKSAGIRAGPNIDSQKWMHVGKADDDGISFTLYVSHIGDAAGYVQVTYHVEFAYPIPF